MNNIHDTSLALNALENLRKRLLDLTGRNRLINFRHNTKRGRGSLRIIDELPSQLADKLLSETEMRFQPIPEPTREELIKAGYIEIDEETGQEIRLLKDPTAEEWAKYLGFSTAYEVPKPSRDNSPDKHCDTAIQTLFFPYELETRLKSLLQISESAIQEMGANILYLVFGFLEWFDSSNDSARIAPLFLVPVRLHKGRLNAKTKTYQYTLTYSGEEIIPNLSLREKLRIDFAMALPDLDESTDPEEYFKDVQSLIQENQPRWRLRRFISLALLNFSKLLMYLDLDTSRWPDEANIIDHPLVMKFLSGYSPNNGEDESNGEWGFGEEYSIDEINDINTCYPLIDDADSSQHSALIDAVDGKNLVIEGPPGTGKSQTITNLIAATMAQGKRVLFVAEKLAALEVVRRRLDAAGLGEFCLELHSHKSHKRRVLDEVENRLRKRRCFRKPEDIEVDITRYEELKTTLTEHAHRINRSWKKTGLTLHDIFMTATRYRESIGINPLELHPIGYTGNNYDPITKKRTEDQVEAFQKVYQAVVAQLEDGSELKHHPWYGVRNSELQIFDLEKVKTASEEWQDSLLKLNRTRTILAEGLECNQDEISNTIEGVILLLDDLKCLPSLQGDELLDFLPMLQDKNLKKAKRHLKFFRYIQSLYTGLVKKVGTDVLNDLSLVRGFLSGKEQLLALVDRSVELGTLSDAIYRLKNIQKDLAEIYEPLKQIQTAIGEEASRHIMPTEAGLAELKTFMDLVASLKPEYWHLRNNLFENDALDALLPKLRDELTQLHALHDKLKDVIRLDSLPSQNELSQLKATLDDGGFFRWLKKRWRKARKQVLGYAATSQIRFPALQALVENAAAFVGLRYKINGNREYQAAFGDHLKGLETNLTALESLRSWYRKVRWNYGVGFGKKVALGNAIIDLPADFARSVRSLTELDGQQQLESILDGIGGLKQIFSPISELQCDTALLAGNEGIVYRLISGLKKALRACEPVATDHSISIAELARRIEYLGKLTKAVRKWEDEDLGNKLFQGRLILKLGLDVNNKTSLSTLTNTITVAACVDNQITNKEIRRCLYEKPEATTFSTLSVLARHLETDIASQSASYEKFAELVELDTTDWFYFSGKKIEDIIIRNNRALSHCDTLQNWLDYVRVRNQVDKMGFVKLVGVVERGDIEIRQVRDAYFAGFFDLLAREILREIPEIASFSGYSQQAIQDKFKEYDERLKRLQRELIAWKIDQAEVPKGNSGARVSEYTELCLLEKECSKKTRHIPIRQLLHRASGALVALKPCFMMGPMSVAQYLAPGKIEFDIVVMDEASQIKPQDALGAIARGAQLIVVGDPKQLPPTRFFDRIVNEEEEDPTAIEESESILDATLPIFFARRLRWHYRSRHESLISFSNHSFYDNSLVLFPSPYKNADGYGIKYSRVSKGCFVNRRNMEEASIIAEAVRKHFQNQPEESLGVVAMSAEQRLQLERSIETLAKEDFTFQEWLEKDTRRQESLFIKNLENVQGDERDVIMVSMTYGPKTPEGRVFQRFGPINSNVGWRRLNVLFTRSKKRMHIFSSMGSEDIIADGTSKRGVQALRDFLAFCETGILHETNIETGREPDSSFEVSVMAALRDNGFECAPQVGVAGFFIDIAIIDPGNPGRYLMGIECDGANYHSAKSARDRDRLRQMILERLGWRICRIWSTDWFKNSYAQLQPIIRELNILKTEPLEDVKPEIVTDTDLKNDQEPVTVIFQSEDIGLREKLIEFDRKIIREALPDTPDNQRLLRPAMLEALIEYIPIDKSEFLEFMPSYLRQSTSSAEGRFLKNVLEIINNSVEETI